MNKKNKQSVCIIGLGYVGLTLAVHMAKNGIYVKGIENNPEVLRKLEQRKAHFYEPKINEYLERYINDKIEVFSNLDEIDDQVDTYIITVGTPISNGQCDLSSVNTIIEGLKVKLQGHELIMLRSTVKIGTTKAIEKLLCQSHPRIDLAFCPERTLEGKALEELSSLPQIIGANNVNAAQRAQSFFAGLTDTTVNVSNSCTAEMIKLTDNAQRDIRFAYSNEIAMACDMLDIDILEVVRSGGLGYTRSDLALPGPVGGPCLSKDPYILHESLNDYSQDMQLTYNSRKTNEKVLVHVCDQIKIYFGNKIPKKIAICGMAFKGSPATSDLRGSPSLILLEMLKTNYELASFYFFDPYCYTEELECLGGSVAANQDEAFTNSDLVILATNNPSNQSASMVHLGGLMKEDGLIYDLWNLFEPKELKSARIKYLGLGRKGKSQ